MPKPTLIALQEFEDQRNIFQKTQKRIKVFTLMLKGKHILLGITGSIAAYKAAILVRLLVKEGADVKVIMHLWPKNL